MERDLMKLIIAPGRRTDRLGGTGIPDIDTLQEMHASQYILHAAGGQLTRADVEKSLLPHSNNTSPQAITVDRGAGDLVYVQQPECLCKSTNDGRTWTSRPIDRCRGRPGIRLEGAGRRHLYQRQLHHRRWRQRVGDRVGLGGRGSNLEREGRNTR
jgi:hypothetical protein